MLTLGRRNFQLLFVSIWAGYTIEVTDKLAKRLHLGKIGKLSHQGSTYTIKCASRERLEEIVFK